MLFRVFSLVFIAPLEFQCHAPLLLARPTLKSLAISGCPARRASKIEERGFNARGVWFGTVGPPKKHHMDMLGKWRKKLEELEIGLFDDHQINLRLLIHLLSFPFHGKAEDFLELRPSTGVS